MAGRGSSRNGSHQLTLRIILLCALAVAAITLLPLAMDDTCIISLSRSILSCAGDNNRTARLPIVTDQLCVNVEFPPDAFLPPLFQCCPPPSSSAIIINFTFPDPGEPVRTRRPVHVVDMGKQYERAVALMKALPETDPRSFVQQAKVHCAYCTGAHRQVGFPEVGVEIHSSWLFFPFHRAHLFFFERIAAKLLGDPGFALPVWTWDVPAGMRIPAMFTADEASPLYDPLREPSHAPPKLADLDFVLGQDKNLTDDQQILLNLRVMYRQMVSGAALPSLFLGQPYRGGDPPSSMAGAGTMETAPHNTMHVWVSDNSLPELENMGAYYSAGRDPLFYPHHANVDRLWESWRAIAGAGHVDFSDPDWLDSSFLLYDEEARLVRITVRDVLRIDKLGYTYGDDVGVPPWLAARPPTTPGVNPKGGNLLSVRFPVSLDAAAVTTEVRRPRAQPQPQRTSQGGRRQEEVLLVEGIEVDGMDLVRFDVYVNAREYHKVPPGGREMAGSFVTLKKHPAGGKEVRTSSMRVALREVLEDLGAQGNDSVTVTLVPVRGRVTIGGLRIVYIHE